MISIVTIGLFRLELGNTERSASVHIVSILQTIVGGNVGSVGLTAIFLLGNTHKRLAARNDMGRTCTRNFVTATTNLRQRRLFGRLLLYLLRSWLCFGNCLIYNWGFLGGSLLAVDDRIHIGGRNKVHVGGIRSELVVRGRRVGSVRILLNIDLLRFIAAGRYLYVRKIMRQEAACLLRLWRKEDLKH